MGWEHLAAGLLGGIAGGADQHRALTLDELKRERDLEEQMAQEKRAEAARIEAEQRGETRQMSTEQRAEAARIAAEQRNTKNVLSLKEQSAAMDDARAKALRIKSAEMVGSAQSRAEAAITAGGDRYTAYTKEGQGLLAQGYGTEAKTMGELAGKSPEQIQEEKLKSRKLAGEAVKAGVVELSENEKAVDLVNGRSYLGNPKMSAPDRSGGGGGSASSTAKGKPFTITEIKAHFPFKTLSGKTTTTEIDEANYARFVKYANSKKLAPGPEAYALWLIDGTSSVSSAGNPAAGASPRIREWKDGSLH